MYNTRIIQLRNKIRNFYTIAYMYKVSIELLSNYLVLVCTNI
jgi:hypothetical protein